MPKPKLPDKNYEWTPELAYVVGLLVTDGNLSKNGRCISMRSSDMQLLLTFTKCLGLSREKIVQTKNDGWAKRPCYRVQFSNVQLYRWLTKIGLFPNKTYTIGEIQVPDQYFKDFLRGHLDGDGSIWTYKDSWNSFKNPKYVYTRLWARFYSASVAHIRWIQRQLIRLLAIKGHTWERKTRKPYQTTNMWELKFAKKESIKLLSWIYYRPDIPCLKRKRKIAEKFISKR